MIKADWKRKIFTYRQMAVKASKRRIDDRLELLDIIRGSGSLADKIDKIIDYFRAKYEGTRFRGLALKERLKLFEKYDGLCMWCTNPVLFANMTVEHIVPLSEGGTNEWDNLGCACGLCNNTRDGIILDTSGYLIPKRRSHGGSGINSKKE